jgi:hypothetical protein
LRTVEALALFSADNPADGFAVPREANPTPALGVVQDI